VVLAGALLGLAGCPGDDDSHGTLVVPFKLGNDRMSCGDFGVKVVVGELGDGKYTDEVKCEAKELRFDNVPAGEYKIRVFGYESYDYDDHSDAIMDSLQTDDLEMSVIGDGTTVIAGRKVMLTSSPAHLLVRWSFGYGTCKSVGVSKFVVSAWRNGGSELILEDTLECENVGDSDDSYYRQLRDPDRRMTGDDDGEITIQPLDRDGSEIGEGLNADFKGPGPGKDIQISVKCDEDNMSKAGVSCWIEKHPTD
jgi:hypothetical protein